MHVITQLHGRRFPQLPRRRRRQRQRQQRLQQPHNVAKSQRMRTIQLPSLLPYISERRLRGLCVNALNNSSNSISKNSTPTLPYPPRHHLRPHRPAYNRRETHPGVRATRTVSSTTVAAAHCRPGTAPGRRTIYVKVPAQVPAIRRAHRPIHRRQRRAQAAAAPVLSPPFRTACPAMCRGIREP